MITIKPAELTEALEHPVFFCLKNSTEIGTTRLIENRDNKENVERRKAVAVLWVVLHILRERCRWREFLRIFDV